jgi:hypothetical protein
LISLVYIWWAVPETKGQTLEQIEQGWIDRAKLRHPTTEQQPLP